jgi:adenine-specific DNA-methyltransferase
VRRAAKVYGSRLVVYADPPYSRAQYSRYYHLLETLILYDYPRVEGMGLYRQGRFETAWSRLNGVEEAADGFVRAVADSGAPLYLSYPSRGLLHDAGSSFRDVLSRYYSDVATVLREPVSHSTMGGAPGRAASDATEEVFHARRPS